MAFFFFSESLGGAKNRESDGLTKLRPEIQRRWETHRAPSLVRDRGSDAKGVSRRKNTKRSEKAKKRRPRQETGKHDQQQKPKGD
jgi:hypothetical protein